MEDREVKEVKEVREVKEAEDVKEVRNIGLCFRKGIAMYLRNFKKIFTKTWYLALAHALMFTCLLVTFANYYLPLNNYANVGLPVNETLLFAFVVTMIIFFILGGIFELGFYIMLMRIFAPGKKPVKTFIKGIGVCLRHFPATLGALCLSLILVIPALCIFLLPAIVLLLANVNAQVSLLNGDALGSTGNMATLTYAVFFISGIIKLLITSLPFFILYYACGSMMAKDEAKAKFNSES